MPEPLRIVLPWQRVVKLTTCWLAAVMLGLSPGCIADRFILGENHEQIDPRGAARRMVRAEGVSVECWVARSPGARGREPAGFVLFFVGIGDRADRWAQHVAQSWGDKPIEVWGMNYPGSGGSAGPARLGRVGPAALASFDAVARAARGRPVFVQAGSLGTTAALCVAARRPVTALVLQNPPPLRNLILGRYGWWNLWLVALPAALSVPDDLDSIANARRATAPAVFVLSGADETVPPQYARLVVDAYAGPKCVIRVPRAHHNDPLPPQAARALSAEIDRLWRTCVAGMELPARRHG